MRLPLEQTKLVQQSSSFYSGYPSQIAVNTRNFTLYKYIRFQNIKGKIINGQ
jgi:hypothetical protein